MLRPTLTLTFSYFLSAKVCPKLKSRYKGRAMDASDYTKTIDDFDNLIDPRTLSRHFLGPEPSPYFLQVIAREKKK